jgi:hypothetical protein
VRGLRGLRAVEAEVEKVQKFTEQLRYSGSVIRLAYSGRAYAFQDAKNTTGRGLAIVPSGIVALLPRGNRRAIVVLRTEGQGSRDGLRGEGGGRHARGNDGNGGKDSAEAHFGIEERE